MSDIDHAIDKLKKENREIIAAFIADMILELQAESFKNQERLDKITSRISELKKLNFSTADRAKLHEILRSTPSRYRLVNGTEIDVSNLVDKI